MHDRYIDNAGPSRPAASNLPGGVGSRLPPLLSEIKAKGELVVTHEGTSQYSRGGASACGLASLNAVKWILSLEHSGMLTGVNLLSEINKWGLVEEILSICHSWTSTSHLDVEDILKLPMITHTLQLVRTEHAPTERNAFVGLLGRLQQTGRAGSGSSAAVITRPPEIVAVFNIKLNIPGIEDVFVLFDSHPRHPKHPDGAAFIFFSSLDRAADHLASLFAFDQSMLQDPEMQWQVQLFANFSSHVFVSRPDDGSSVWDIKPVYAANVGMLEQKMLAAEAERKATIAAQETARLHHRLETLQRENARIVEETHHAQMELERLRKIARSQDTSSWRQSWRDYFSTSSHSTARSPPRKDKSLPSSSTGTSPKKERPKSGTEAKPDIDSDAAFARDLQRRLDEKDRELDRMRGDFERELREQKQRMRELEERLEADRLREREDRPRDDQLSKERRERANAAQIRADTAERRRSEHKPRPRSDTESDEEDWGKSQELARRLQQQFDEENERLAHDQEHAAGMVQPTFDCRICMDDHPLEEIAVIDGCHHQFCRDGLKQYIVVKLQENWFPVLCPVCTSDGKKKNPAAITGGLAEEVGLSEEEFATWHSFEIAPFAIRVECPKCKKPSRVDQNDYKLISLVPCPEPTCDATWCKKCSQVVEAFSDHSCDGSKELDSLMENQKWKRCPGCETPSSKDVGCNHMRCAVPNCNMHFCYICGAAITKSVVKDEIDKAVQAHYQKCTLFDYPDPDEAD